MTKINYIILLVLLFGCNNNDYEFVILKEGIQKNFVEAALERTKYKITYNGNYFNINYPNGDIPEKFGVCTDVIVRSYRKINIDLQQLLHEDIKKNFNDYPIKKHWPKQRKADSNIDHRRVPNLEIFFSKYGKSLSVSNNKSDYKRIPISIWDHEEGIPTYK